MIQIYGIASSRALRPLWLLEEIGMEYEHIPLDFRGDDLNTDEYQAMNPNGRIPTMVDDDLILFESMAINLYLARKYGGEFFPDNEADAARANMWSYWVMTEVEERLLEILLHSRVYSEERRDERKIKLNKSLLRKPFDVLEEIFEDDDYLLGEKFSVADINVASIFSWCRPARLSLEDWPGLQNWLERCIKRPAFKRAIRKST